MRMPGFWAANSLPATIAHQKPTGVEILPGTVCKCAPACMRVTMCLLNYCTEETICDECAYSYDCVGPAQ